MIKFKLISSDNSIFYYSFFGALLDGIIVINKETSEIAFEEVDGFAKDDEKEKAMLLYIAQKKIKAMDFPDRCIYATH